LGRKQRPVRVEPLGDEYVEGAAAARTAVAIG
jgi:hypothetical protein